jgi:predicted GNAT family N-acyltransferase
MKKRQTTAGQRHRSSTRRFVTEQNVDVAEADGDDADNDDDDVRRSTVNESEKMTSMVRVTDNQYLRREIYSECLYPNQRMKPAVEKRT